MKFKTFCWCYKVQPAEGGDNRFGKLTSIAHRVYVPWYWHSWPCSKWDESWEQWTCTLAACSTRTVQGPICTGSQLEDRHSRLYYCTNPMVQISKKKERERKTIMHTKFRVIERNWKISLYPLPQDKNENEKEGMIFWNLSRQWFLSLCNADHILLILLLEWHNSFQTKFQKMV